MLEKNKRLSPDLSSILLAAALLCIGKEAFGSPVSLIWVHATVRAGNEWGKGGTGFRVIRKMEKKQGKVFLVTDKHVVHPDRTIFPKERRP